MSRRSEHLIVLAVALLAVTGSVVGSRFSTFRLFFSWPGGGIWSNMIAWVMSLVLAAFAGWYVRDRIGRGLVGWLHQHHAPHLRKALEEHHGSKLEGELSEIKAALRSLHERLDGD